MQHNMSFPNILSLTHASNLNVICWIIHTVFVSRTIFFKTKNKHSQTCVNKKRNHLFTQFYVFISSPIIRSCIPNHILVLVLSGIRTITSALIETVRYIVVGSILMPNRADSCGWQAHGLRFNNRIFGAVNTRKTRRRRISLRCEWTPISK